MTALRFQTVGAVKDVLQKPLRKTKPLGQYTKPISPAKLLSYNPQTPLSFRADGRGGRWEGGGGGGHPSIQRLIYDDPSQKNTSNSRYHRMVLKLIRKGDYFICKRLSADYRPPHDPSAARLQTNTTKDFTHNAPL